MLWLLAACAPQADIIPESRPMVHVSAVKVLLDAQTLTAEQQHFLRANDVAAWLQRRIRQRLAKAGILAEDGVRLVATIVDFDLRNDVEVLVLWPLRQADWLEARVSLYQGPRLQRSYKVRGRFGQGGTLGMIGGKARLKQVIESTGWRIVQGLHDGRGQ